MSHSRRVIDASYALCRRTARRAGSSFYRSFLLLPKPKRRAMDALYAFTRYTDDLADNPEPLDARRDALARWRTLLEAALSGSGQQAAGGRQWGARPSAIFDLQSSILHPPSSIIHPTSGDALLPALADAAHRFQIPAEHLFAVVDGVQMDLDRATYETFEDLVTYCQRVASAVGMACIHVWGFRGEEAAEQARNCGIAFQMTNILRDVREDAEQGRVYLPLEDLRRYEYSLEDLAAGVVDARFARLMEFQIDRARRFYHEGAGLFEWLEPDGRRVFGMMMTIYHGLLERIAGRPGDVFCRRVGLSGWQKARIAARWALLPARRSALP